MACVIFLFYCVFYALKESGCLDLENDKHVFVLHYIFKARINYALKKFAAAHPYRKQLTLLLTELIKGRGLILLYA